MHWRSGGSAGSGIAAIGRIAGRRRGGARAVAVVEATARAALIGVSVRGRLSCSGCSRVATTLPLALLPAAGAAVAVTGRGA